MCFGACMNNPICVKAPGKIILSGEHSVVYGCPALAASVAHYATVDTSFSESNLTLTLQDLSLRFHFQWYEADEIYQQVKERYQRYRCAEIAITAVTSSPEQLLVFAIVELLKSSDFDYSTGMNVCVSSEIPMGSGMGSSAAIIAATLSSVSRFIGQPLLSDDLYAMCHRVENIQHGVSSGLDPAIICTGGFSRWTSGSLTSIDQDLAQLGQWFLIDTGHPLSSTGECVESVKQRFGASNVWSQFARVTAQFTHAVEQSDAGQLSLAIHANQQLLTDIGVVPKVISDYVSKLVKAGFVAKISGAGAVVGEAAGMLLIYSAEVKTPPSFRGLTPQALHFEHKGVHEYTGSNEHKSEDKPQHLSADQDQDKDIDE